MTATVTIEEAQSHLREWIAKLSPGDEMNITDNERPVARLVIPHESLRKSRRPGSAKGKLTILSEDDSHLSDFAEYL